MNVRARCPACGSVLAIDASPGCDATAACTRCGRTALLALTPSVTEDREVDSCPVCEGRAFYVRKDLNRTLGLASVVAVGLVSAVLLWAGREPLAYGALGAMALADFLIYQLLGFVTVCYSCQAEFRGSYRRTAPPFDLHTAENLEKEYARRLDGAARVTGPGTLPR
jgi:hypothetical protein